ncbi:GNAT family N-acetyltransferase [Sulfurimonas sp. SAG-AH-194-C21]|nr:GNAT family N-acyltransferase [Sulfurimonas sp. SAG-AH-194-C21]MDF1882988.1 GNAT family N-acetyltransferase [Sulfurimonas sp. SAG-AH-194-C21]
MIDIEMMIKKKYPKLQNNKIIKGAIKKFSNAIVHQSEINNFIEDNSHLGAFEFIDNALEELNFSYTTSSSDIENIPATGRVVIVSNHPLGGLDAFALIKLIRSIRSDIKIVANDFLTAISPLKEIIININSFKNRQDKASIHKIYESLHAEEALIIFPAGEVSRARPSGIKDGAWKKSFLKFASKTDAPILPVFIGGKNSTTFYSVSALNKKLSILLLANEMFLQKNKEINIIVGEIIPKENIQPKSIQKETLVKLYKKHTYGLRKGKSLFQTQKPIALAEDRRSLKKELKESELLGATKDGKKIYLYEWSKNNSSVLNELGRLRELSFRKVGEGINKKRDIDKYDRYYKHIILWDNEDLEIVGAYRIGVVSEIVESLSPNALYTNSLFDYTKRFDKYLDNTIELGRSFVQPKYWGSRALDYLWQGIGAYLSTYPNIKYLLGPVSISGVYPTLVKDMILYFYSTYFGDISKIVLARQPYVLTLENTNLTRFISELKHDDYKHDFKVLKKSLSLLGFSIPTMYKQYSDLCEDKGVKFCAYNIDKEFSNCIDSFIILEVDKIKPKQRQRYFL